ncbi:MAG: hypothetical protein ISQ70_11475 [Pirellulales bacterium]|nr:hypothetical protein [Pirellulales bacterium]MBL7193576.1 hypothetical protein [Pirellulales bacterium]
MSLWRSMRGMLLAAAMLMGSGFGATPAVAAAAAGKPAEQLDTARLASLVEQLGDPDYGRRHAAMRELEQLGGSAIDQLLEAAEQSNDLEIALRARWLVHSIPLSRPHDSPAVTKLLDSYKSSSLSERVSIMHRLLRLDDAAGIEPLGRLLRLEQSPAAARVAAALLVREWSAGDLFFRRMMPLIRAGIGESQRPAAALVRAVVDFEDGQPEAIEAILAARDTLQAGSVEAGEMPIPPLDAADEAAELSSGLADSTNRVFDRLGLKALVAAERRAEALQVAETLLADVRGSKGDEAAAFLAWCVEHSLAEVVDTLRLTATGTVDDDLFMTFAAAVALTAAGQDDRGQQTAAAASRLAEGEAMDRLQAAVMLAKWGATEWASREYERIVGDPQAESIEFVLTAVMFSEFLHDQGREDEAAKALAAIFQPRPRENVDPDTILRQLSREPATTRSRMLYFEAVAAADRGELGLQRQKLEESIRTSPKDVDALIALHGLADATPLQQQAVRQQIDAALAQIEREIAAKPDEPNGYNEYAWLAANTADRTTHPDRCTKATRYSQRSLELAFDNASYLDTLAHCHAAEGNFDRAIRAQTLAARYEPHNNTIRRNLARFQALAAHSEESP